MTIHHKRGFTLVELLVVLAIIAVVFALLVPAVQKVRAVANRTMCESNLHQIGLALAQYNDANDSLPPGVSSAAPGQPYPRTSWLTRILPYVEQVSLWNATVAAYSIHPSFALNPPHIGLSSPIALYGCPSDPRVQTVQTTFRSRKVALTSYVGVVGLDYVTPNGVLFLDSRVRYADIRDGMSATIMVGERPPSTDFFYGWWYGGDGQDMTGTPDMLLGVRELNLGDDAEVANCSPGPYHYISGNFNTECDIFHFWSPHSAGANFLFADGSVHFLLYNSNTVLPALASRAGGEVTPTID